MKELLSFVDTMHAYFMKKDPAKDKEKHTLLRSLKLSEEIGELNEQILIHYGHARKDKLDVADIEHLEHEVADVIICSFMIAKSLDIDVQKALANKIKIVKKRHELS